MVRAEFGALEHGAMGLHFYDDQGRIRAGLLLARDGATGLELYDEEGRPRVLLSLDPDREYMGAPSLALSARKDVGGSMALSVSPDGSAMLEIRDNAGN